ncbi:MAG: TolB family protein, partial [Gemmatimonadota bacterium]
ERIAYRSNADGDNDIWIASADGSGAPANVIDNPHAIGQPAWSPDGLSLAVAREDASDGNLELGVTDPDAENPFVFGLTDPDSAIHDQYPAWSPGGRRIAFTRGPTNQADVYVVHMDGTGPQRLTRTTANEVTPDWSPDGRRIVYTSARDGNGELYIIDLETGEEQRLTRSRASEVTPRFLPRP